MPAILRTANAIDTPYSCEVTATLDSKATIAIACQRGGTHAAFLAGVLTAILNEMMPGEHFDRVCLGETPAGPLCALMVCCGFAANNRWHGPGSPVTASRQS